MDYAALAQKFGAKPVEQEQGPDYASLAAKFGAKPVTDATPAPMQDDPGFWGSAAIGMGRTLDRAAKGLEQGFHTLTRNKPELDRMAQQESENTRLYGKLQDARPGATMLGEIAPMLAIPAGGSLKAAAAISAIPGLMEYGTAEDKLSRGAFGAAGGALGYGAGKMLGKTVSPAMKPDAETQRLAQVMAGEGVPLNAAQVTQSPQIQKAASALKSIPWTAGAEAQKEVARQQAYNSAVLKRIGSDAKAATPDVMADAHAKITGTIENIANSVSLKVDDKFLADLARVEENATKRLPTDQWKPLKSYIDDILASSDNIPGQVYQNARSELGKIAYSSSDNAAKTAAKDLQRALDSAFDRQAPKSAVSMMNQSRSQYRSYMQISDALQKSRSESGDIPAKQLYAAVQRGAPDFVRGGGGELADVARAGRRFLPDPAANSSRTAEAAMYQNLLTAGTMGGLGAAGGALSGGDPISGLALGLGGFGLSRGASGMLNSPALSKHLARDVLSAEQKKMLEKFGAKAGLLGSAAYSY